MSSVKTLANHQEHESSRLIALHEQAGIRRLRVSQASYATVRVAKTSVEGVPSEPNLDLVVSARKHSSCLAQGASLSTRP
jgi:hypothetical protein